MTYTLYQYENNTSTYKKTSLTEFTAASSGDVISFAGAGGKTTVLTALAKELAQNNLKTLITTTTKMYWTNNAIPSGDIESLKQSLYKCNTAITGKKLSEKMEPPDADFLTEAMRLSDIMLVEADGARRLPFKFPRENEPVYLKSSDKIVYLAGLSALNQPLIRLARPMLLADFLQKDIKAKLTADDIIKVLTSPHGAQKDTAGKKMYIILNQADDAEHIQAAKYIISKLTAKNKHIKAAYSCFK